MHLYGDYIHVFKPGDWQTNTSRLNDLLGGCNEYISLAYSGCIKKWEGLKSFQFFKTALVIKIFFAQRFKTLLCSKIRELKLCKPVN